MRLYARANLIFTLKLLDSYPSALPHEPIWPLGSILVLTTGHRSGLLLAANEHRCTETDVDGKQLLPNPAELQQRHSDRLPA